MRTDDLTEAAFIGSVDIFVRVVVNHEGARRPLLLHRIQPTNQLIPKVCVSMLH
jgi:hypothetical protein